jgi:hypothetical protein
VEFFSSNTEVNALANLSGLVGFAVILWQSLRFAWRFLGETYRNSLGRAIGQTRRRAYFRAWACARDIHIFTSELCIDALFLVLFLLGREPISTFRAKIPYEFIVDPSTFAMDFEKYASIIKIIDISLILIEYSMTLACFYILSRMFYISYNVKRMRIKYHMRNGRH